LSERIERFSVAVVVLVYAAAVLLLARSHAHFRGDDLGNIYLLHQLSLFDFTFTPADAHFSPLHRLATAALHRMAPWNFDAALTVLLCAHCAAVVYLQRVVRLLWNSPSARWVTAWYATSVFLGFQFLWWSSASHRLPYIALSVISVYYYLVYRQTAGRRAALLALAAFVGALGFLGKGVLVPALLVGVEVCIVGRPAGASVKGRAAILAAMLAVSVAFGLATLYLVGDAGGAALSPSRLVPHVRFGLNKIMYGSFGVLPMTSTPALRATMTIATAAVFAWSLYRAPINALAWLAAVGLLAVNVVLPATAPRGAHWTLLATLTSRYYYETLFIVAIFGAIAIANATARREVGSVPPSPALGRGRLPLRFIALAVALLVYACTSFHGFRTAVERRPERAEARRYMRNLLDGMASVDVSDDGELRVARGRAPHAVVGFNAPVIGSFDRLLPIIDRRAVVVPESLAEYRVTDDGRVLRLGSGSPAL